MKVDPYAQMGRAALLPGMQHLLKQMEDYVASFRLLLEAGQQQGEGGEIRRGPGRPPKDPAKVRAGLLAASAKRRKGTTGWEKFDTPEKRRAEMMRRRELSKKNKARIARTARAAERRAAVA